MSRPYSVLRGLMKANDETQTDLCRLLLISRSALSARFNGTTEWKLGEMYAILNHYGVPHEFLSKVFPINGLNSQTVLFPQSNPDDYRIHTPWS